MSEEKFRPNRINTSNNINRLQGRIPTNNLNSNIPIHNVKYEEQTIQPSFQQDNTFEKPSNKNFQQNPNPINNYENEYLKEDKKKKGIGKKIFISIIVIIILFILYFIGTTQFKSVIPTISTKSITNSNNDTVTPIKKDTSNTIKKATTFDGQPIPVKWPSDVTPTKMEIQLDPITGEPILLLIGDKAGLGTVIRSYNKSGDLSGFWVIVPEDTNSTNSTNTTNTTTNTKTDSTDINIDTTNTDTFTDTSNETESTTEKDVKDTEKTTEKTDKSSVDTTLDTKSN